jgi:hypothetical protein
MTIEAVWDSRLRGFKYKLPRAGFVTPSVKRTSIVSPNAAIIREVKAVAFAVGVRLPSQWELSVTR